ncbi:DUF4258 domain-containing protein [Rhodocaloribacter litoris]|uniref:DUF4258 domain-containing protein n=1 Tax=Rhodocaloribacter litoris TaxID=2558931 RepID=UPI001E30D547|nr:DUF4258 domain-containing protein [Rhodocaloribacter litoris]QXD16113.1 DUF4258 domain-containing protein [Rhodocaloribacter litoris]
MDYVLTRHCQDALAKRQIRLAWLERALRAPETTEPDPVDDELEHRLVRIPDFDGRVLRVIVNVRKTPPHVVTAFFDRRRTFL